MLPVGHSVLQSSTALAAAFPCPAGQSAKLPLNIRSLPFNNSGRLTAVGPVPPEMKLTTTQLADFASQAREGSVAYYSISPATRTDITVGACSNETRLVMAVFVGQVAEW